MTISRKSLEAIAFWDGWVCVGCAAVVDELPTTEPICPECSGRVMPAAELLELVNFVEVDEV
jgi:hypothetical protein